LVHPNEAGSKFGQRILTHHPRKYRGKEIEDREQQKTIKKILELLSTMEEKIVEYLAMIIQQ
jgi:hypothetical protein